MTVLPCCRNIANYKPVLRAAFEDPALTTEVKWQAKDARQNGIHVIPTFMIAGIVSADMSSGDAVEVWLGKLGLG